MTVSKLSCAIATGMLAAYGLAMAGVAAKAQTGVVQTEQVAAGGRLHGVVKRNRDGAEHAHRQARLHNNRH
jgi:hypothetical protein